MFQEKFAENSSIKYAKSNTKSLMKNQNFNKKTLILLFIATIFLIFIYNVSGVITPFVVGWLLAYILYPLFSIIEVKTRISKKVVALFLAFFIWFILIVFCSSTLPVLYKQLLNLYEMLRDLKAEEIIQKASSRFHIDLQQYLPASFSELSKELPNELFKLSNQIILSILNSTKIAIDLLMTIIIAPLTCYFVLKDWNVIGAYIDKIFTKMPKTLFWLRNVDYTFRTFLLGQFLLALFFVFFYSFAFIGIELNSALVLGLFSGITCFLPYIGAVISFIVCIAVAILQFNFSAELWLIILVFAIGHLLDLLWISPKLVGNKIGLHPLLTIFAMLASAQLFGVIGMFLAMPATVIIQAVLVKVLEDNCFV